MRPYLRFSRCVAPAAAVLALSPGAAGHAAPPQQDAPAVAVDTCPSSFPANWRCLRVAVPEDYAAPDGAKTEVRVVVAPAGASK